MFHETSGFCREKVDGEQDEQEFENDIMAEVSELEAEAEEDYQRKMSEYRRQHEEWKSWKRKQVLLHMGCNYCFCSHNPL